MKIRQGFVSNSSSSSFVIATNGKKLIATVEIDLENFIHTKITNENELIDYILDYYGYNKDFNYEEDLNAKNLFNKYKNYLNEGLSIMIGTAEDCSNNSIEEFVCTNGLEGMKFVEEVKIIESGGGY